MPAAGVLAFSDLAWGARERGAPGGRRIDRDSFLSLIDRVDPGVVVFAGDAAYDRCSRSGLDETELFLGLLHELAAVGRHCVVVEGNNDDTMGAYGRIRGAAEENPFLHEIPGRAETVCGIRFLGVPTGQEKRMAESIHEDTDIIVAHAPLADRIWLFDIPAPCIVTGHYGMMVSEIAGKAYVALDCSPVSYAVIEPGKIEYVAGGCRIVLRREEGITATGCDPVFLREITVGCGSISYRDEVEALQRAKREIAMEEREEVVLRLLAMGIGKTHIERYLGKRRRREV